MTKKPALDFTDGKEVRVVKPTFADLDIVGVPIPVPPKPKPVEIAALSCGTVYIFDGCDWNVIGPIAVIGTSGSSYRVRSYDTAGGHTIRVRDLGPSTLDLQLNFDDRDTEAGKAAFALLERNLSRRDKDRMAIVQGGSIYKFDAVVISMGVTRSDFMMTTHINLTLEISNVEAGEL